MRRRRVLMTEDRGQSLVEIALALPLLLMILLGLADLGRVFYYTSVIENAARVGAAYASSHAGTATAGDIAARVCNETGFVPYSPTASCPGLVVTSAFAAGEDAEVTVTYDFEFLSAYLVDRVFRMPVLRLRASATFPGMN